jgi:HAD superfamily hydrolase (TIGR01549 family)
VPIPKPPQAVTFDCWETLLTNHNWEQNVQARIEALIHLASGEGVELAAERARELIEGSWREHVEAWRRGALFGPAGASRWCLEQLGLHMNDRLAAELTEALAAVTTVASTRVIEGAAEALASIRSRRIPTALICDTGFTPGPQVKKLLADHGLKLDHYFFSDEFGSPKPHPSIFKAALKATGAEPSLAVHIGDLRRTDIAGARASGMATIRFAGTNDDSSGSEEHEGQEADALLSHWGDVYALLGL